MSENKYNDRCFVIMPFSTPEGYEKDHFTKIYEQIIKPAVQNANLKPERVDENLFSTDIVTKIFKGLTECDMAICDLSSRNPNVLYELGIRQAYNKPVLLIKDEKTDKIFDVGGLATVPYESNRLYENVTDAVERIGEALKEHMRSREGVVDIIRARLGNEFKESTIPSSDDIDQNQKILLLLQSLTNDMDSLKNNLNKERENISYTNKYIYMNRIKWESINFKEKKGYFPSKDELLNILEKKYNDINIVIAKTEINDFYNINRLNNDS